CIELHQRQFPFARNRPCTHALTAPLHPENDHASRRLQAKGTRLILPSPPPLCQPVLQIVEPPMLAMVSDTSTKSSISERRNNSFFDSKTSVTVSAHKP